MWVFEFFFQVWLYIKFLFWRGRGSTGKFLLPVPPSPYRGGWGGTGKNTYDSVVRDILYSKMNKFKINDNIILTVKYMLDNFKLKFGRSIINTTRGLAQGSTLSPILFNIYLNDLLNLLEKSGVLTLAFADDIACWCQDLNLARKAISIMKWWCIENGMQINASKNGIMRF